MIGRMTPRILKALLVVAAATVIGPGCRGKRTFDGPTVHSDGVRFRVRAVLLPGDSLLEVRTVAVNAASAVRTLDWSPCQANFSLSSIDLVPPRRWEYSAWATAASIVCPAYRSFLDLAPGDSVDRTLRLSVRQILGDSLPPGRYRLTAPSTDNDRSSRNREAGPFELRRPPA